MNTTLIKSRIDEVWHHAGFQKYFRNTGWLFIGRIFVLILSFFVGVYTARYLGPSKYGILNYVISIVGIFSIFANLGINNILSLELIKNPAQKNVLMGTTFLLQILGAGVGIVLIGIFVFFIAPGNMLINLAVMLVSTTFLFQAFNVIDIFFQSNVMSKKVVIIQMISFLISSILKVVFIYYGVALTYFISLLVLEALLLAIGLIITYNKTRSSMLEWKFSTAVAKQLLLASWPLMLSSASLLIYARIDQIMLKYLMGEHFVGIYSVSVKLSEAWIFIPSLIVGSLFPAIVNSKKVDQSLYEKRLKRLYAIIFYLSLVVAISIFSLATPIVALLFGGEYASAVAPLRIYVWSGIATALGYIIAQYLTIEGKTKMLFSINFLSMTVNIALNFLLIPILGISGSAIATLISYSIIVFSTIIFRDTRRHLALITKAILLR